MTEFNDLPAKPPTRLKGFDTYADFVAFIQKRFKLEPQEYEALYNVLLKLQGVGSDPLQTLQDCQSKLADGECLDMLKFMMYVDGLEINDMV